MKIKKKLLLGAATLLMSLKISALCQISATANYNTTASCSNANITVSGSAVLKTQDSEGQYVPCGGQVKVLLQKYNTSTLQWDPITFQTVTSTYSIPILPSYGNGLYRINISNPNSSCGCSSSTSWNSNQTNLTFNAYTHANSFSLNGTPTFNSPIIPICGNTQIELTNVVMTNQSSVATVNKWRIGTANDSYYFASPTWETGWHVGPPPATINILPELAAKWGTPTQGIYSVWLQTYNGCSYTTNFIDFNVYPSPTYVMGQKYDATNANNIPGKNSCTLPYTNICPSNTAPYSYILTAENTTIATGQLNNSQWSCQLEEYPLNNCAGTPVLTFTKPFAALTSMSDVSNIDLNAYATTYGGKPVNYVQTYGGTKKWKFTINFKYSCNVTYSYTCWLAYNVAGCRVGKIIEESTETVSDNVITLFPNPTSSNVEISTNETIKSISVYDVNGKESKIESINNNIDLSAFKSGIYTLKIYTENGISTKKIIKQD